MTNRERLFAVLNREHCDRVPIWLLFPYHHLDFYADVMSLPCYRPVWEEAVKHTVMLDRRTLGVPVFGEDVVCRNECRNDGGWEFDGRTIEYKGRRLFSGKKSKDGRTEICRFVENDSDLEFFCSLPLNTGRERIEECLSKALPSYLREKKEFPEHSGAMMLDIGEPVGLLYHSASLNEYPIWSLTHDKLVTSFFDRLMEHFRIIYNYCLERDLADVYFLVGSELASPPMVSRETFRRWIVPYASELVSLVRSHGKKTIQHYHGQIREILPDFLEMRPDALHTIEAPPTGNCTLSQAFETLGDEIAIIGNIQYDCFRSMTPAEMAQEVRSILDETSGRPFILSPTAGPFDSSPPETVIQNYLAFIKAGISHR
ncbi:MAG: hypothetical protein JW808_00995 [Victivallales bacterium]|nr:hypothetical protein [Victivallales bacterium]